jgi:hypothetical protein
VKKFKTALIVINREGIGKFLKIAFNKVKHFLFLIRGGGYKQYNLEFTPIDLYSIKKFLVKQNIKKDDLIFVPQIYKKKLNNKFKGKIICTLDNFYEINFLDYTRLIWATERVDFGANIVRLFYKKKKEVKVLANTGPARVWMHDEIKEKVLQKESCLQIEERIQNFSHGIGSDYGDILQCIDNTTNISGDIVEIGCYMGSGSCVIASYLNEKKIKKRLVIYDTFEGFNYEEAKFSLDENWTGSHVTDGYFEVEKRIRKRIKNTNIKIDVIKRNIIENNALKEINEICFAIIDVDLYEAVYAALHHVHKKLSINGIIVVEDAGHTPMLLGAKLALEEFLNDLESETYLKIQMESGIYILFKKK